MRLNLGCGKHYKNGYINIDAYDATVADKILSVENLPFHSNTIEAIEANQLIEHLGYTHTFYALAEWFRVLKPDGTLLLETPDIKASMEHYLNGDHTIKKETLTWLYGAESPGMEHRLCFPKILLSNLLKKTGFTGITSSYYTKEDHHPVMRITCRKPQNPTAFQIIAEYRKILLKYHFITFENSIRTLEQEKLIDFFLKKLHLYLKKQDEKILKQITITGCIHNPPMTLTFLKEIFHQKKTPKQTQKKYNECASYLSSIQFSNILYQLLKDTPPIAGTQKKTMHIIIRFGKQSIKKILTENRDAETVKQTLMKTSQRYTSDDTIFFSESILEYHAADLCYKAMKYFSRKDFTRASSLLQEAIKLDRNHLLYYWNLGRVLMLTKKYAEAERCYKDALTLIHLSETPSKRKVETLLRTESTHFSPNKHGTPLLDVRE